MTATVTSLRGGAIVVPEPNQQFIELLEETLVMARAGEVVGGAMALLHGDGCASYTAGGTLGGYSIIGAVQVLNRHLVTIADDVDEF